MRCTFLYSTMLLTALHCLPGCSNGLPFGSGNSSSPYTAPGVAAAGAGSGSWLSPKATMSKVGSTVSQTVQKASGTLSSVAGKLSPNTTAPPANDPTSLNSQVSPLGSELHVSAAALYEAQGNLAAANEQYQRAIKATPNDPNVWLGYARSQARQGKLDEAIRGYGQATKLDANNAAAWNDMGMCQSQQGQQPAALEAVGRATQLQPANQLYRTNMARLLVQGGRVDEALAQLNAVMAPAHAHYHLGYLYYEQGNNELAAQQFTAAAQIDPNLAQARQMLGVLQGKVQGVQQQVQAVQGQVQAVQGQVQAVQGQVQSGLNQFQTVSQQFLGPAGQPSPALPNAAAPPAGPALVPYGAPAAQ